MNLSVEHRVEIGRTKIDSYLLEEQLLLLFDSENMIFGKDEQNRITNITKDNTELPLCVQIAANIFLGALQENPKWYEIPVKADVEKTVLYTDEKFQELRNEFFTHVRNPNRYLLVSQDNVISALQREHFNDYEAFFKLASCVSAMSAFGLLKPMVHPKEYCANLDEIFNFIDRIKNSAVRWQCWAAFHSYWLARFSDIDSVMLLYFFMLEDNNPTVYENLNSLFGKKIINYFSGDGSFISFGNLSRWCNQFSLDMQIVRFSFICKIIEHASISIEKNNIFFKYVLFCKTTLELKLLLELILKHERFVLLPAYRRQRGAQLLELMSSSDHHFRFASQHPLNAHLFCVTLLNVTLPELMSNRALDDLPPDPDTYSCMTFFSKNSDNLLKSEIMNCDNHIEKVTLIVNAIKKKRDGEFLKKIKSCFAEGFFEKVKAVYDAISQKEVLENAVGFH